MNIIEKRVKDLKPYEKNPRKNDDAVQYVANSIKEFGFRVPIVIDSDNTIVCGHTRWKASKLLNMETVPCVVADDLTEEQIKAFRIADNKVSEMAGWDFPMLDAELAEIEMLDMEDFGFANFNHDDIDDFFKDAEEVEKEEKLHTITCPHCGKLITLTKDFHIVEGEEE